MNPDNIARLISELDIAESVKSQILDFVKNGQTESAVRVLNQYRSTVLDKLHSEQDRLYQIDFALQKMKEETR